MSITVIEAALPERMPSWGKVRIGNGGDIIRTVAACFNEDRERNMSYVRVRVPR